MDNSNFIEIQQFRQGWLLALVLVPCISALTYLGFTVFRNWPMSGTNMLIYGVSILALVLVPVFMLAIKMVTEVKNDAIHIRFFPFKKEAIPFSEIAKCDARQYSPIKEYGGWGIRYGTKGMAYNVSGDHGVQLELTNGKRLLIGSQRSEELTKTIK
ncbi:MAG: DUF6141 family protein, partial [Gemmatimonadetes bacterium]|nr:DUF6141 family protein [Gemmatimonadota bacterium]